MMKLYERLGFCDGGVITLVGAGGKTSLMFRLARELAEAGETVLSTTTTKIGKPETDTSEAVIISSSVQTVLDEARKRLPDHLHLTAAWGCLGDQNKLTGFSGPEIDQIHKSGLFRWILVEGDGAARRSLKAPAPYEPVIPDCTRWLVTLVGLDAVGKALSDRTVFRSRLYAQITGLSQGDAVTEASIARAIVHDQGLMKGCPSTAVRYVFFNKAEDAALHQSGQKISDILLEQGAQKIDAVFIGAVQGDPHQVECRQICRNCV
ncbi:MAG: selenium cofactor biosynthesis protein YqeC [Desulfobacterales bacterium]|nr:selenium cofactor biosynthesis protein YqeC [Desulfobacterales bacterium]MDD4073096.1 selenium cofactor biosynthesis protein YqeC [Desulfobacterales bacterium]MDD4393096.1 selenium cofactor biosynthesis protein YqeC [Desulfobacterales bacterium]